ncbi:MAG TPA: LecA/PA-IL family lectin [Pyrinomonadaceae bacterium]|nr:LecA/PA-IL family lectin [Pyrinomonadaceae bacterium]
MWLKSKSIRVFTSLLMVVILGVSTFADTLWLKDGSRIKGKIVSFADGKFTVAVGQGPKKRRMTFTADQVQAIVFETPVDNPTLATNGQPSRSTADPVDNQPQRSTTYPTTQPQRSTTYPNSQPRSNNNTTQRSGQSDTTIITDDGVQDTTTSTGTSAKIIRPNTTPSNPPTRKVTYSKPVELSIKVHADNTANGWTNSGWIVKKGQRIRVSGTGEVSIGKGKTTGPSGLYDVDDSDKLLKSVPTGALIAVIGDDNNDFIYIGSEREFTASRDGALFLGLNEGNLNDNSGSYEVKIEISPEN